MKSLNSCDSIFFKFIIQNDFDFDSQLTTITNEFDRDVIRIQPRNALRALQNLFL
jgi:hypothetical protein